MEEQEAEAVEVPYEINRYHPDLEEVRAAANASLIKMRRAGAIDISNAIRRKYHGPLNNIKTIEEGKFLYLLVGAEIEKRLIEYERELASNQAVEDYEFALASQDIMGQRDVD